MDNRPTSEYAQPGSHHHPPTDASSEQKPADPTAATHYTPQSDVQPPNISSSRNPHSDYGLNSPSTRSPYQDNYRVPYAPNSQPGGGAGMAQATNPSLPVNSPTYPPPYSPYQPQGHPDHQVPQPHGMPYQGHQGHPPMYPREWSGYGPYPQGPSYQSPATTVGSASPTVSAKSRPGKVYSFVPIPGAQQHKRPRRRYEEIERMYKCGWNNCEKAYGTLNHLNAHVTMQSHGQKRTPEEFKEIRKEWKARKKEEEAKKQHLERDRAAAQANKQDGAGNNTSVHQTPYSNAPQLPPMGYHPAADSPASQYGGVYPGSGYPNSSYSPYPPGYAPVQR